MMGFIRGKTERIELGRPRYVSLRMFNCQKSTDRIAPRVSLLASDVCFSNVIE